MGLRVTCFVTNISAASILPNFRRHHGRIHHPPRSTVLVQAGNVSATATRSDHSFVNKPSTLQQEGIGMKAINDAFICEMAIYRLIKKHFRNEPYYLDIVELFHETTFQTELGQLMDLITAPEDDVDLKKFSIKKYALGETNSEKIRCSKSAHQTRVHC